MLVAMYKIGKIQFYLLGTNRSHTKTKNERFTAAASHCRPRTSNMKTFTSSYLADWVQKFHLKQNQKCKLDTSHGQIL